MTMLDPNGLEAAYDAGRDYVMEMDDRTKQMLRVAIRAYLSTVTPAKVGGLVDAARQLWSEHGGSQHGPRIETLTMPLANYAGFIQALHASALRLSSSGWRDISSAPKDGTHILLDLGETIPDLIDVRVGQWISEFDAREIGEIVSVSGGWIIWNSGSDFFILPHSDAHGWMPLPSAPALEDGHE